MDLRKEAVFWQVVGALSVLGGGFLLVHVASRYGLASAEPRAIELGFAGIFIILAGAHGFLTGRGLLAELVGMNKTESVLLVVLAAVGIIGGAVTVVVTKLNGAMLLLDRVVMGIGGALAIMLGLICLLGQRLMCRMHQLGGHNQAEVKAKAKAAGA